MKDFLFWSKALLKVLQEEFWNYFSNFILTLPNFFIKYLKQTKKAGSKTLNFLKQG